MPRLSDSMEEGTLVAWLVADGDTVERGQDIAEIESDKATVTYAAEASGVVRTVISEGDTVLLGAVIARIEAAGEALADVEVRAAPAPEPAPDSDKPQSAASSAGGNGRAASTTNGNPRQRATPIARRIARTHDIALETLEATGPRGAIVRADVERALLTAESTAASTPTDHATDQPAVYRTPSRIEQLVARRMSESRRDIPEYTVAIEIDMTGALAMRAELKAVAPDMSGGRVPSVNDLVVKAVALALRDHPRVNSAWIDDQVAAFQQINIGVAVATDDGSLVVPVVRAADSLSVGALAATTRELTERARTGKASPSDFSGGTFTVSNLGMFGVSAFTAVITSGQGAILSVGAAIPRPVQDGDGIAWRPMLTATLTSDHRIIYGAHAAAFLKHLQTLLEHPASLSF
jgi:pyruvate dehydrogenase E2 component (dihydrolipoamide acetyltransferase)